MSENDIKILVKELQDKVKKSYLLVEASLNKLDPYDKNKFYSPDELEPYDALSDRFIRCVEICLKFFRAYEKMMFAVNSDTVRDILNQMEKLELISSTEIWMNMRNVRNKIVHDYLPTETKIMYDEIMGRFWNEFKNTKEKITDKNFD